MPSPTTTLNDAISGDRAEQLTNDLQHQKSRLAIKDVVQEHIDSSKFAGRVKEIMLEALEADPAREKLSEWVTGIAKSEVNTHATARKERSLTRIIGVGGLITGALGVGVALLAIIFD